MAIDPPVDTRGTVLRGTDIKWEWARVGDATRYEVSVNGSFVGMASSNYFYSRDLSSGNYSMTVKAVDSNGSYSGPSQAAERSIGNTNANTGSSSSVADRAATNSALSAPRDPRGTLVRATTIKWEWSRVDGAAQYEVFVNDASVGLTTDLFLYSQNLSGGEHRMRVRAVDNDGNRSVDSNTATQSVAGGGTSTQNASTSASNNNADSSVAAPSDPRGTRVRPAEIKWEWESVGNAAEYEVTVNGAAQVVATTFIYTKNLQSGEHTMTVRAITSDGKYSAASNTARASTTESVSGSSNASSLNADQSANNNSTSSLRKPRDVRGTEVRPGEVKWEWSRVEGASQYEVYLDGASAGTTSDDYLYTPNLSSGEHAITVAAIDNNGGYSEPSDRASTTVSGGNNSQSQTENVAAAPPANVPSDDNGLIDPATYSQGNIDKDGYELTFSDEFNAGALNPARWNTNLRWDGSWNGDRYEYRTVNGEDQFYVNIFSNDQDHLDQVASVYNPFKFNGSRLAIRATRNPLKNRDGENGYGPLSLMSRQKPFLSGAITTYDKFVQKYGYFEARIKIPSHVGTFPAFWLHHQRREWEGTQKTEIDIMENLGHAPWYVYNSFHYFTGVAEGVSGEPHFIKPQPQGQIYTGTDYSEDYHVYAAEWQPGHIRFLIDGVQVSEVWNSASDHEELYLLINLAIGGNWTNFPSNAGGTGREPGNHFPTQNDIDTFADPALEIDYVRVYKRR